jgi:hypothetical protein
LKTFFVGLVLAAIAPAKAQTVVNASFATAQPTISRDASGFERCGVRVVASVVGDRSAEGYDFSVNIDAKSAKGFVKGGKYLIPAGGASGWDIEKRKVVMPQPVSLWIAGRDQGVGVRPEKLTSSEDKGFVLGIGDLLETSKVLASLVRGEPVQVALRYPSQRIEQIVAFRAQISQDDQAAVQACLDGLMTRWSKEVATAAK